MKQVKISNNVIRRLPRYLRTLDELKAAGTERISSSSLGEKMSLTSSQIRQDFSCFGEFGQQGYGYNVKALRGEIASILGTDRNFSLIVAGVGNIGRALLESFRFDQYGFNLLAAFDIREEQIGKVFNGIRVQDMHDYKRIIGDTEVDVAVLSVPQVMATETALGLIDLGIKAIWNFTNVELDLKDADVIVENIHFSDSLLALSYYLTDSIDTKAELAARPQKQQ